MNYSTAVMLFNDDIRAVTTTYEEGEHAEEKTYKTLDKSIEEGDLVVIETGTRHGFTVVKVKNVDVDVDPQSSEKIGWIVNKVSIKEHENVIETEERWIASIKASEKRKQREDIKKNMVDLAKEQGVDLDSISSKTLGDMTAIEAKPEEEAE